VRTHRYANCTYRDYLSSEAEDEDEIAVRRARVRERLKQKQAEVEVVQQENVETVEVPHVCTYETGYCADTNHILRNKRAAPNTRRKVTSTTKMTA
jgi:hypothetical protein